MDRTSTKPNPPRFGDSRYHPLEEQNENNMDQQINSYSHSFVSDLPRGTNTNIPNTNPHGPSHVQSDNDMLSAYTNRPRIRVLPCGRVVKGRRSWQPHELFILRTEAAANGGAYPTRTRRQELADQIGDGVTERKVWLWFMNHRRYNSHGHRTRTGESAVPGFVSSFSLEHLSETLPPSQVIGMNGSATFTPASNSKTPKFRSRKRGQQEMETDSSIASQEVRPNFINTLWQGYDSINQKSYHNNIRRSEDSTSSRFSMNGGQVNGTNMNEGYNGNVHQDNSDVTSLYANSVKMSEAYDVNNAENSYGKRKDDEASMYPLDMNGGYSFKLKIAQGYNDRRYGSTTNNPVRVVDMGEGYYCANNHSFGETTSHGEHEISPEDAYRDMTNSQGTSVTTIEEPDNNIDPSLR